MVSNSVLHAHIGLIVSLKPYLNLFPFRWHAHVSLERVGNFAPIGSWTEYKEF